ncbi:MAG: hypothetical protein NT067_06625 [Candidatus Diapherotrites archaeon]|nr:hypothetical protein [Candidatus Diapherotrites archaeon]
MNLAIVANEAKFGSLSLFFSMVWIAAYVVSLFAVRPLLDGGQPIGEIVVYMLIFLVILCPLLGVSYGLVASLVKREKNKTFWKTGLALSIIFLFFVAYLKGTNSWL